MRRWGYIVPAVCFFAFGLFFRFALVGYSFLSYFLFASGGVTIVLYALKLAEGKWPKLSKIVTKIAVYGIVLFCFVLAGTLFMLVNEAHLDRDPQADYAVVLGAKVNGTRPSRSLAARLEAAKKYAEQYPDAKLVVSGGQGNDEDISEADCMRRWLIEAGVPESRIITEDRAGSTLENILYSMKLIYADDKNFDDKICIITENFHLTRASLMARDVGVSCVTYGGYTGMPVLTCNYYLREAFAVWYYMLFER